MFSILLARSTKHNLISFHVPGRNPVPSVNTSKSHTADLAVCVELNTVLDLSLGSGGGGNYVIVTNYCVSARHEVL